MLSGIVAQALRDCLQVVSGVLPGLLGGIPAHMRFFIARAIARKEIYHVYQAKFALPDFGAL